MSATAILSAILAGTAIGAATGAGARSLRHAFSPARVSEPYKTPGGTDVQSVDIELTPEEAEEMRAAGYDVASMSKQAGIGDWIADAATSVGKPIGTGFGAAVGAYMGWQGASAIYDYLRKRKAKQRNQRLRDRITSLLDEKPEDQDLKLAACLEAGTDNFVKEAGLGDLLLGSLGVGLGVSAISGWRGIRGHNKNVDNIKKLKSYLAERDRMAQLGAGLYFRPVVRKDEEEEADREHRGSPAQQAAN